MFKTFVITAKAENVLRVLQRLTSLMTRKQLKAVEMHFAESSVQQESLLTLTLHAQEKDVEWLMKQLGNFVDLFDLSIINN